MTPNQYKVETGLIKKLIEDRHDFFLGGCGIGCTIRPTEYGGWMLYFERARLTLAADELEVKDGKLILSVEGGYSQYGELELAHYLKVTVVW